MRYELTPDNGRKSFYRKAFVEATDSEEILLSYNIPIIKRDKKTGKLTRLWNSYSTTTGNHIKSFCGLNKKEFLATNME